MRKTTIKKVENNKLYIKVAGDNFWQDLEIIKSCTGRTFDSATKLWTVKITSDNLGKLEKIESIKEQIQKLKKQLKKQQEEQQEELQQQIKQLKQQYPFLYDYQAIAAYLAMQRKFFLIADEMGLGKTVEIMPFIDKTLREGKKVIILAPSSLLRQWNAELQRFINRQGIIVQGLTKQKRLKVYVTEQIILTTYESFWRDVKEISIDWSKVVIVADEASKFKNKKTKIWQSLREIRDKVSGFIALTGTPVENSLVNFFNIIQIIDPKFMSAKEFYNRYCTFEEIWNGRRYINVISGYKNLDQFLKRIEPLMIRRKKSDVHELPEKIIQNRVIPLTKEQAILAKAIRTFAKDENKIAAIQLLREVANDTFLLRVSNSKFVQEMLTLHYIDDISANSNKLTELEQIFEELNGQKVLIFTQFSIMAKRIKSFLSDKGIKAVCLIGENTQEERQKAIEQFKEGRFQVLVATDIFGYGINLQFVDVLINFDIPWNPAKLNQRIDRVHRVGAKNAKVIINLISEDIDEKVFEVLQTKQNLFDKVVNGEAIDDESIRKAILQKLIE